MTLPDNFDNLSIPDQIASLMHDAGARRFEIETAQMAHRRIGRDLLFVDAIEHDCRTALGLALEVRRLRRGNRISDADARGKLAEGAELMREIHRQRPNWKVRP